MFEYSIIILEKVSFNASLFSKELQKAIQILTPVENQELEKWFFNYSKSHSELEEFNIFFLSQKIKNVHN